MVPKFDVKWGKRCYLCNNPTNILMSTDVDGFKAIVPDMVTFFEYHPVRFDKNDSMWKVKGGRAYKCCKACWEKPWPTPNLRDREVSGRSRRGGIRSTSLSESNIYTWFMSLHYYMKMDPEGKYERIPPSEMFHSSGLIMEILR
mgnify:CR=1 FL=1|jgi:hypothetical protein